MRVGGAVLDIQPFHPEALERFPYVRVVVDADHHLALAAAHGLGQLLVLVEVERHAVAFGLPVRWVGIKEGMRAVVAFQALLPRQVLDIGTG